MSTTEITRAVSIAFASLPTLGGELEGGIFCGLTTNKDGAHFAVVLLAASTADLNWSAAMAWAKEVGGELPSRPVAALLFANAKSHFKAEWHWTSETCDFDASYAWYCHFLTGDQFTILKSYEGCARAVRLIPLMA
jgi:hypothetical protein